MAGPSLGETPVPRRWLWPLPPLDARDARTLLRLIEAARPLVTGVRWLPTAVAAGVVPLGLAYLLRLPGHQLMSGLLLFPLFLVCVRDAAPLRAFAILLTSFGA